MKDVVNVALEQVLDTVKFSLTNEQIAEIENILFHLYETGVETGKEEPLF